MKLERNDVHLWIWEARTRAGLRTQTDLATRVGQVLGYPVSRQLVGKWERGESEPSVSQWAAIAAVCAAPWMWDGQPTEHVDSRQGRFWTAA